MTCVTQPRFNQADYERLPTVKQRAEYLLQFEIEVRLDIIDLMPVFKAHINDIGLPFHGDDKDEVVAKAKAWLQEKAQSNEVANEH